MKASAQKNIVLGVFVTLGVLLLIGAIYFIGARQNLFGSVTKINAVFNNVSGLQVGNNVRFSGINVGTVESINIISDSSVRVTFVLDQSASKFIKKDAEASIGSAGLMGNKIVSISAGSPDAEAIEDGDEIEATEPIEIQQIISDLQKTTESAKAVSNNLSIISERLKNGEGIVGNLFADTTMTKTLDEILLTFEEASGNALSISRDLALISDKTRKGEGFLGQLLVDDELNKRLDSAIDTLVKVGESSSVILSNLEKFSEKLNNKESTLGKVLTDTAMANEIDQTINEVRDATQSIDNAAEKVNNHWLLNPLFGGNKDKKDKEKKNNEQ